MFAGIAKHGQSSIGWFFGFKLHLVVSHTGTFLAFAITPIGQLAATGLNLIPDGLLIPYPNFDLFWALYQWG